LIVVTLTHADGTAQVFETHSSKKARRRYQLWIALGLPEDYVELYDDCRGWGMGQGTFSGSQFRELAPGARFQVEPADASA
jgi:hypothetical protein